MGTLYLKKTDWFPHIDHLNHLTFSQPIFFWCNMINYYNMILMHNSLQVRCHLYLSCKSDPHLSLLSSHCSHNSPGLWQRTPALPKWWGVHQQPLQLSPSLHRCAVWEAPLRVRAGRLQGPRLGPGPSDASVLPQAAAADAAGLGAAERGHLLKQTHYRVGVIYSPPPPLHPPPP